MMTGSEATLSEENPYFQEWTRQIDAQRNRQGMLLKADRARDFDMVAKVFAFRKSYIQKYAHAIPTGAALNTISSFAPIVEMAAGTGYWASLLRAQGVDVICYDRNPPGQPGVENNRFHEGAKCWTEVLQGDDSAIDSHPHRTLLLCWPPPNSDTPVRALTRYRGEHFIYIGELPEDEDGYLYFTHLGKTVRKGVTIVPQFFAELRREWDLLKQVELPHWEICLDNLYAFKRKVNPQMKTLRISRG
jgi:hypothetical protein